MVGCHQQHRTAMRQSMALPLIQLRLVLPCSCPCSRLACCLACSRLACCLACSRLACLHALLPFAEQDVIQVDPATMTYSPHVWFNTFWLLRDDLVRPPRVPAAPALVCCCLQSRLPASSVLPTLLPTLTLILKPSPSNPTPPRYPSIPPCRS